MEIRNQKNHKKIVIAVVVILVIIAGVVGAWFLTKNNDNIKQEKETTTTKDDADDESSTDTDEQDDTADDTSDEANQQTDNDSTADNDPTNGGKTPPRYEGGNIQDSKTLTGTINGISMAGNNLSIRVTVNQYISDPDGRCELTLTSPTGATYNYWSDLIQNPQTTSCYGWDIPLSDFGGSISGHWVAEVKVSGDNRTGTFTEEVDL